MLTNLYVLIMTISLVQITPCKNLSGPPKTEHVQRSKLFADPHTDEKKVRALLQNEAKYFESIVEPGRPSSKPRTFEPKKRAPNQEKNYHEIKTLLSRMLEQISELEKRDEKSSTVKDRSTTDRPAVTGDVGSTVKPNKKKKKEEQGRKTRWGHWTDWSSCSVSCGKGRQIRWRHCIENCSDVETEMEEKTCQLPACGPGKLFGVITLR